MIKRVLIGLVIAGACYIYFKSSNSQQGSGDIRLIKFESAASKSNLDISEDVLKYSKQSISELEQLVKQCNNNSEILTQNNVGYKASLQLAIEDALENGHSYRQLLSHSASYSESPTAFSQLINHAKLKLESRKYNYTDSFDVLANWYGVNAINGLTENDVPVLIKELKENTEQADYQSIKIEIDSHVSKAVVYQLLENDEQFNTYLSSPFIIGQSHALSPSILFILSATTLSTTEFEHAIANKPFTVNEVAVALKNQLPQAYLSALLARTEHLEDFPTSLRDRFGSFNNLADIAVSEFNVPALKILADYGVHPSNEAGVVTGMDIALHHIFENRILNQQKSISQNALDTLAYLQSKGYKAHGHRIGLDTTQFSEPYGNSMHSGMFTDSKSLAALNNIALFDTLFEEQVFEGIPEVAAAINTLNTQSGVLNAEQARCKQYSTGLMLAKGYEEPYAVIKQAISSDDSWTMGERAAETLHNIEPVLVNIWQNSYEMVYMGTNELERLISRKQFLKAHDYVTSNTLTLAQTDSLLASLVQDIENILPIWQARVSPIAPSNLTPFKNLDLPFWQRLAEQGFDFTLQDEFGGDLFSVAALTSPDIVNLLLEQGYHPELSGYGIDIIDAMLLKSLRENRLDENLGKVLTGITTFENGHYALAQRVKTFMPKEYERLIVMNKSIAPKQGTQMSRFKL